MNNVHEIISKKNRRKAIIKNNFIKHAETTTRCLRATHKSKQTQKLA